MMAKTLQAEPSTPAELPQLSHTYPDVKAK